MHEVFFYGLKPHISCYILLYQGAPLGGKKVDEREKTNAVSSPLAKDFLNVSLIPEQEYTKPQLETLVLFPLHAGVDMKTLTQFLFLLFRNPSNNTNPTKNECVPTAAVR